MNKLLALVFVLATLWGGYWFVGSSAVETGLIHWLSDRQKDGWVAEYTSLDTRGFPNRFDTTIVDLELADPRTGVAWVVPEFKILALSYKPNHIIAELPTNQTIASPNERIQITNSTMRGSVVFDAGTSLALNRSSFVLGDLALESDQGWTTTIDSGSFATRQTTAKENSHDINFEASGVVPPRQILSILDPANLLPDQFETLQIDSTVGFDAPWDRFAIERKRPAINSIDLKVLQANWGNLDFRAAGDLTVDSAGTPDGQITIRAENWREMLNIAVSAGLVPNGFAKTVERAMELLAGMSGTPDTIDAPLTFKNGRMSFGPIPLGPAPKIRIR